MYDLFFLMLHILKFDVIYVMLLILLITSSALCCNEQGPCD